MKTKEDILKIMAQLRQIPAAVLSDVMNRMNCMDAGIKPLKEDVNMVGTALTVKSMAGCNWGTHKALTMIEEHHVLVVDARQHLNTAVWGFLQTTAAIKRKAAGVIIDGSVRDSLEIKRSSLPLFCRGKSPAGPHKGWKDDVQTDIQCGGVVVKPGDFIKGDDDGVVVIPAEEIDRVIPLAFERLKLEEKWFAELEKGKTTFEIIGLKDS